MILKGINSLTNEFLTNESISLIRLRYVKKYKKSLNTIIVIANF